MKHSTEEDFDQILAKYNIFFFQILQVQRGVKELKWTQGFNSKYSNDECLDDTFSCHSMGSYLLSVAVALPAVHVQDGREVFRIPEEEKCLRRANKREKPSDRANKRANKSA